MSPSSLPNPKNPTKSVLRGPGGKFISQKSPAATATAAISNQRRSFFNFFTSIRIGVILLFVSLFCLLIYIFQDLPSPTRLSRQFYPVSTKIFDRNGILLYEIFADQNRTPIKLVDIPESVKLATISIEDKNFYTHQGLAIRGIARATLQNIKYTLCKLINRSCNLSFQGGSTITQQLVKTALLTPERTLRRKIRELALTLAVETIYTKDQILEMYLNQVPYGGTSYGIESAAQTYFGKKAKDLNLAQSALLAGLPAAPTTFSPFGAHPELARDRQVLVLTRMKEDKHISEEEYNNAKDASLDFAPAQVSIRAPHFVLYIKDLLVQKYGEHLVEQGGLRVTTSLDIDLQDFAQQTIASEVAKLKKAKVTNAASLVTNPSTGEILSMVGSQDYFDKEHDGNVNVTLRPRQPGSSIKPLNYALGIESNIITPATVLVDLPTCFSVPGQKLYCPENYDHSFHGPTQVRFALGNSYNIPAIKMLTLNGLENFINKAREFGISTWQDPKNYGLSLTLGGGEVKMIDMATAFAVFANSGNKINLHPILKVESYSGKILEGYKSEPPTQIISSETAYLISHILLDNNARSSAFGSSSYLNVPGHPEVSVKTGTTNDKRDNWAIGYNSKRLVAVWVGNNDNSPLGAVASGITGASPIWNKIIKTALKDIKSEWPEKPENIIGKVICNISGLLPPDPNNPASCYNSQYRFEYFKKENAPTAIENIHQDIQIDKTTLIQATPKTPPENIETQNHAVITDLLKTQACLDCSSYPTDSVIINPQNFVTPTPTPIQDQTTIQ